MTPDKAVAEFLEQLLAIKPKPQTGPVVRFAGEWQQAKTESQWTTPRTVDVSDAYQVIRRLRSLGVRDREINADHRPDGNDLMFRVVYRVPDQYDVEDFRDQFEVDGFDISEADAAIEAMIRGAAPVSGSGDRLEL